MSQSLPRLSRNLTLNTAAVDPPVTGFSDLPERVVQFGTGAFLRGFVDAFLDQANRSGSFGGRVVAVGSTSSGRSSVLNDQDGLYTLCVRGYENGRMVERCAVVSSLSRALNANDEWREVLACARKPEIDFVISNTTEVGIRLDSDDRIDLDPPRSFPGKLTAFLHERARAFAYDPGKGVTVLCCELIEKNGEKLQEIVQTLARRWRLDTRFLEWLPAANRFCNTLVDRIVPGRPAEDSEILSRLGYSDDLLVEAEPYRLWAIEGDESLRIEFAGADPGIIIAPDIRPYRERKVRILNGTHTIMVPLALLCGNQTVCETTKHPLMSQFIRRVMFDEIVAAMDDDEAPAFAEHVLERFANPFIRHALRSILLQQTMKMEVRVAPSISDFERNKGVPPRAIAFGFAAYLLLIRDGRDLPQDDGAEAIREIWQSHAPHEIASAACERLGIDSRFAGAVRDHLERIERRGVACALEEFVKS